MEIRRGARLAVRTALEDRLEVRALGPIERGRGFRVVWVCRESEWARAHTEGSEPIAAPIPEGDILDVLEVAPSRYERDRPTPEVAAGPRAPLERTAN
jgi:hypothetical protein